MIRRNGVTGNWEVALEDGCILICGTERQAIEAEEALAQGCITVGDRRFKYGRGKRDLALAEAAAYAVSIGLFGEEKNDRN